MVGRLVCWFVGSFFCWSVVWLPDNWSFGWLVGWSVGRLLGCWVGCLGALLIGGRREGHGRAWQGMADMAGQSGAGGKRETSNELKSFGNLGISP